MKGKEEISISLNEYKSLINDQLLLEALEEAGVDDFELYHLAKEEIASKLMVIDRDPPNIY